MNVYLIFYEINEEQIEIVPFGTIGKSKIKE